MSKSGKRPLPVPLDQYVNEQALLKSAAIPQPAPLPVPNPTRSFWLAPEANPLAGEGSEGPLTAQADVVIIGSGITGLGAAYHLTKLLAKKGEQRKIVILEARDFCSGATGRNGGHLAPNIFHGFVATQAKSSTAIAKKSIAIEHYTASCILSVISTHSLEHDVDLVAGNRIDLFFTQAEIEGAKGDYKAAMEAGIDVSKAEWLDEEYMEKTFGTSYIGTRIPAHNLWPLKFVTKLHGLASCHSDQISVSLHTRTPATAVVRSRSDPEGMWTVETPRGSIKARFVLHATNAYASHLLPHFAGRIWPTRGQVVAIREYGLRVGKKRMEAWTGNEAYEYWFPRPRPGSLTEPEDDPVIILGGGREGTSPPFEVNVVDDSTVNEQAGKMLREFLPAVFEGGDVSYKVEQEWTGIMGYTLSHAPFVGPVLDASDDPETYDGQYICAGYTGHGMPRAFACAEAVAQLIDGAMSGKKREEWEVPDWLPDGYLTWNRSLYA